MSENFNKAAVIGAGTMGAAIAVLLAEAGVDVLLLDIPAKDTSPDDPPAQRNALALAGLARQDKLLKDDPLPDGIRTGNTEDDFHQLADADLVIEAVVEKLDIKRSLLARVGGVVGADAVLASNTSGIPIGDIADGLPEDVARRFLGAHFFNPPRILRLLELIPHTDTDPAATDRVAGFCESVLNRVVVRCKDTPNFIGNRLWTITAYHTLGLALDEGFSVEEVDVLTGQLIGRPKTATFRLNDLVGLDVMTDIAQNLYPTIPDDPARDVLVRDDVTALLKAMLDRDWLGNKRGQGFYKKVETDAGREFYALDLKTLDYHPAQTPTFESAARHAEVEDVGERIKALIAEDDRAGRFLRRLMGFYLTYAAARVPEITDRLDNIDLAQRHGFAHELGPFEIWDALGVTETIPTFEADDYSVSDWVKTMVAAGHSTFYRMATNGQREVYDLHDGAYQQA